MRKRLCEKTSGDSKKERNKQPRTRKKKPPNKHAQRGLTCIECDNQKSVCRQTRFRFLFCITRGILYVRRAQEKTLTPPADIVPIVLNLCYILHNFLSSVFYTFFSPISFPASYFVCLYSTANSNTKRWWLDTCRHSRGPDR